jgi:tRNA A-37 threonylcarbamoyl transferase component Bud32
MCVFVSYVREDSAEVDRLQTALEAAGVQVWRDIADLWPGEDWRAKIRQAITDKAMVFIACFSHNSLAREKSYQNEELILAIQELRSRRPDVPWLMPVRFDDCAIPDQDIGAGRTLTSLQRADLFGDRLDEDTVRLVAAVRRALELRVDSFPISAPLGSANESPRPDRCKSNSSQGNWDDSLPEARPRPGKGNQGETKRGGGDDWPSTEWDELSEVDYWAELAADLPLRAPARDLPLAPTGSAAVSPDPPRPELSPAGVQLASSRYELGTKIGWGRISEVYRARDLYLDRIVAVKMLRKDLAKDQTFKARFRREAQSAASLNHPSIVAVYGTGEDNTRASDVPFIVMEYIDGRTIRDLLRDGGRLIPERALEITDGVLRALDYSHRNGVVHRAIKPGNVMLNRQGEIKVMDFGIARATSDAQATMTQTAQVHSTQQYTSPEQTLGERVDARSDLYSVGCLLYELLTGRPPFTGDSPLAIADQHVRENPTLPSRVDPELPRWADPIVLHALAKDPADRYQTAAEMRSDIQRALSGSPVADRVRPANAYAADVGIRRMDPLGTTQMQGLPGVIPPYKYGPFEHANRSGKWRRRKK